MGILKIIKKFNFILSNHQKIRIFQLCLLMIIGGFLETCSVSLILPFMNMVMNPDKTMNTWYAKLICFMFHLNSPKAFLIIIAVGLAAIYIFKNAYLVFEYNIQYKFVYGNMFALQRRLLETFLYRPYEYFLKINSGEIMRIIGGDTAGAFGLLVTLLSLFTELVVSIMLMATIFMIAPFVTLCIAILLLVILVFIYKMVKPVLRKAGLNQQQSSAGMNKWLLQSIQGIKELKVMGKEDYFQKNYDKYGQIYVRALRWNQTLSAAPRFAIEGVCMGAMFIIVAVMIYIGTELESVIPMLTAVAMAAIRLLPSVNRISGALAAIAYGEPMLDKVIDNLQNLDVGRLTGKPSVREGEDISQCVPKLERYIYFHDVTYHYPESKKNVLSSASMKIHRGESIGIVGTSGAGKTTSVDIILGLLASQEGEVLIDGVDIHSNLRSWLNQLGYIPQLIFMLDGTIRENVAFGESNVDDDDVWKALKDASLDRFVKDLPYGLDTEIGERGVRLSGGQRQRIGIARALYKNPEVLIFDEATSALDNDTETAIMESIHSLRGTKTMIIIAHRLTTIEACDHIYRVEEGKILRER